MAAVRSAVAAGLLLLLLATIGDATSPALVEAENTNDSDLVFEDDGSTAKAALELAKPLLLDDTDRERGQPLVSAVGTDFEDSAEPWGDKVFARVIDDDVNDEDEFDDDSEGDGEEAEEEEEDESANDVALPANDGEEGQGWLMRSMKRIKRSLDSLFTEPAPPEEHPEKKGKKKASQKPRKPKDKKKKKEQHQQERRLTGEHREVDQPTLTPGRTGNLPVATPNAIPTYASGKSNRMGVNRPKRQHTQDGLEDIEGSGGYSGDGPDDQLDRSDATYKMNISFAQPYNQIKSDFTKFAEVQQLIKQLVDNALLVNSGVLLDDLVAYPGNEELTLVKAELTEVPKEFPVDYIKAQLRKRLQEGGTLLRPDGLELKLDDGILDPLDEDRDDDYATDNELGNSAETVTNRGPPKPPLQEPPRTPVHEPARTPEQDRSGETTDLCRGDDKIPCGKTSVFICEVQRCDGTSDCPNGEDETAEACGRLVCGPHQFKCDSKCISLTQKCDRVLDCTDGTDEEGCPVGECGEAEFMCRDGTCIDRDRQCDNIPDCRDGDDEYDCEPDCDPVLEFLCEADNTCIPRENVCDGSSQCNDGADERDCSERNCTVHQFKCRLDNRCIPLTKRCDRHYDCNDYSDEKNCGCLANEFTCDNGQCIPLQRRCDNRVDCSDQSDERNCDVCSENQFTCGNGRCIPLDEVCNTYNDCGDNTDEAADRCEEFDGTCQPDQFTCYDGDCVSMLVRCDGRRDCRDGTDEDDCPGKCQTFQRVRCGVNQFECDDGICIASYKKCNGIVDCHDESDELDCPDSTDCSSNEYSCDGQCHEMKVFCNGIAECEDGSDEAVCITCQGDAFHCNNNKCILPEYRCDGQLHCSDASDEHGCNPTENCRSDEFRCKNGVCINLEFRCDKTPQDCLDNSDEENCPPDEVLPTENCRADEFFCDGRCIALDRQCDGRRDCNDGMDEYDCPPPPPIARCEEHQCPDGSCFRNSQRCDGRRDCPDGYDEAGCPCRSDEFTCGDGRCISRAQLCDRRSDCSDGSDERNCSCARGEFRCGTGQCIEQSRFCDQRIDCSDGSDERDCTECRPGEWQCRNGNCIRATQRCDGRYDCPEAEDEVGCDCDRNEFRCENGPCIPMALRCNRQVDCPYDTSDELDCVEKFQKAEPPSGLTGLNLKTYPNQQSIKEISIVEGNEVVFQCRDEGPMHAKVKWVRANGLPMPQGTRDLNGRLEIPMIRVDHSGEYICEAVGYPSSTPGSSKTVSLTVERYSYQRPPTVCAMNEATCMSGQCIAKTMICDGKRDCSDGSDETSCGTQQCEPNQFRCNNRKCVLKTWLCDGEQDCGDGSDEENCPTQSPDAPCRHDEYQCRSGQCIPKSFQCDTHPDCLDQSDEIGCMAPAVIQPPPPTQTIVAGGVLNITCRATGIPVPLIVWRLNWGHVPSKCVSQSDQGFGRLTCTDMQPIDSGAYSCEIINSMGTHFVSPDTIVIVTGGGHVCQQGYFNNKARNPADCINCFCFGVSTTCNSADLYTYSLRPPVSSLTVVGVEGPWTGLRDLLVGEFENHNLTAQRHGVQLRLTNLVPGRRVPYYSLPEEYKGNQLKSYGGSIRYDVEYDGNGRPINAPDVILKGNGVTLYYWHNVSFYPDIRNNVTVSLVPGRWLRADRSQATREDIMMLLANIESILIRMQYVDGVERNIELVNIMMDSAATNDRGLGSASLVEECRCPPGYRGLSCESCDYNFVRQTDSGPWLGRCVPRIEECRPGYYGDPNRGIPCRQCPCPVVGDKSRARSCHLDDRDNVVCRCDRGYAGERCMECAEGYVGNPLGDGCFPRPPSNCNTYGSERIDADGRCYCKEGVEGTYCDRCSASHFYLHDKGCVGCFCMGVTEQCSSTTWTRDTIQASFADGRSGFSLISDYTNPSVVANSLPVSNKEIVYRNFGVSDDTFYWRLPTQFLGNKLTSYGGLLNYTLRYTPHSSGGVSRNTSPDVVLHSGNKIKLHHYRTSAISPIGSSTNAVPILEDYWQNYEDGNAASREYLLMALANVSDIFIKATYNTVSNEAALSYVSLDIARGDRPRATGARAWPVEHCQCPQGHIGLSCEDCAPGYFKGESGLYLGLCEPCQCNGHSEECDPLTGACLNCRDNTYGTSCELCRPPYVGNATGGTPYDCTPGRPEPSYDCGECDVRGFTGRCQRGCECKQLVEGSRCDQCREGSFGLSQRHDTGCLACFCSGVTKSCGSSNLYREELPLLVDPFDNTITLADRNGSVRVSGNVFDIQPSINEISYRFNNGETYYWSLPSMVLGNQILSYGANLTVTQHVDGGRPVQDQDIILSGNGMKLAWSRDRYEDGTFSVPLFEREWTVVNYRSSYPASRNDMLTVLSNLDHILIRATTKDSTRLSRLSDIILGTAVPTRTYYGIAEEVEMCRCPPGYRGSSCEQCEDRYYRDIYDRRAGMQGVCKPCPCNNADSCYMTGQGNVVCDCREGFSGDNCDNRKPRPPAYVRKPTRINCTSDTFVHTNRNHGYDQFHKCDDTGVEIGLISKNKRSYDEEFEPSPPVTPGNPVIEVVIDAPSIKIVEIGQEFRAPCRAHHLVTQSPIEVQWTRKVGRMPDRAYTDRGTLVITNIQITDSGSYVCRAGSGPEVVYKEVVINVSEQEPVRPTVDISEKFIDRDEYQMAEVRCVATGYPTPSIRWERIDQLLPYNIVNEYGMLRFNSLRQNDAGTYRCVARNDVGEVDALLTVYVRPADGGLPPDGGSQEVERVEIMPNSFDGQPGQQIRLVCHCSPAARVTWSKLGESRLPDNANVRNEILIIEHAAQENTGRYTCTASFPNGRIRTSTVDVVIAPDTDMPPPSNRIAPRVVPLQNNYVVQQGMDFTLPCDATGLPSPSIQWTTTGSQAGNVQLSGSVLRIFNAQPSNGGVYVCVATNEEGIDRAYTVVEIDRREKPVLQIHPNEPQTIKVGESVRLTCRASSGVPYPKITWSRKDRLPISSRFVNDAEGVITLHGATLEDAGEYECRGENVAGASTIATSIEVLLPPIITLQPNEYHKITENDDFVITCSATGKPAPTVTLLPPQGAARSIYRQQTSGLREVTLQLSKAELDDAGTYECKAKNSAGEDAQYLTLQVDQKRGDVQGNADDGYDNETPPRPTTPRPRPPFPPSQGQPATHTYKAILGEQSKLMCNEQYLSAPTYWQRRGGRPLPMGSIVQGGNLTIENTGYDAEGEYDCVTYSGNSQPFTIVRIMVEVVAPPKISFSPTMPMTVRPGDQVTIFCNITGDQPIDFKWHAEEGYSLPHTVRVHGNYLQFQSIAPEDAGRYYCSAWNHHGNTTKVAEVLVNEQDLIPGSPDRKRYHTIDQGSNVSLECKLPRGSPYVNVHYNWSRLGLPLPNRAIVDGKYLVLKNVQPYDEGTYECQMRYPDGRVVYDSVQVHIKAPESLPILQLVPSRSFVKPGESLVVDCSSSAGTSVPIRWEKADGKSLPNNIRQEGNRLYIQNAREDDTGKYTCICYTEDGLRYISDFHLEVEENTIPDVPQSTSRVEHADRGQTVRLKCNTDQQPTSFHWTRPDGSLPSDVDTRSSILTLTNVQASDAGTYICSAKHGGQTVNALTTLVVNNVIPFFPQSPKSYIEYKSFDNVYSKFYFEVSFKPDKLNGLILYTSQRRPSQDYIALSLRNGYPQFRFSFDGQQVMLQPEKPVRLGEWHTVKVNRVRNNGFLIVDDQTPVNFPEKLKFYGLSLDDHLFLGGVPSFDYVPSSAVESREGFVGCISRLKLHDREVNLYGDALSTVGITVCEPCAEDPCNNAGTCMEAQSAQGYKCMCREGFTGQNCQNAGVGCTATTCGVGRCEDTDRGPECYCPVHKSGPNCQYTEHYTDATLAFKDGSYAAYDKFQSRRSIRFRFKADSLENGVMFYAAEHEQAYGDFMAVVLNNGVVELRYSVAGKMKPLVLRSSVPVEVGKWHVVSAGRSKAGIGYLQVDDENVINEMADRNKPIQLNTNIYAGGYDKRLLLSQEIGVRRGFEGCIGELETSGNKVNMIEDIRESANVYDCGHEKAVTPGIDTRPNACPPGRDGPGCSTVTDICLDQRPCENGALCQTHSDGQNYTCTCPQGYLGLRCENVYKSLVASRFRGNGFIEVDPSVITKNEYQRTTEIAIMFSTSEQNGLILWYGQRNGEKFSDNDFIALAVQGGFVELTIRMNGEESYVRNNDVYVADGERHVALIRRERNQFHLQVDSLTVHGETRPTQQETMYIPGSIYIGGVPDIEGFTGNRYNDSFNGCVFSVENSEQNKAIELREHAIRTVNVDECDEPDLGTEPPVV
ncbi:basement membrane-specific heparan sulfate proteoglycan core protein [Anopheles ziemanni]|uniref:basement membrane-specific heparan sulfate proteoglycan core protein n=1 Tax=Anopheles ziemanni TaxID=345580 RepID=UPI00265ED1D9|nr:basement membrane-specific heparan sulfate proteoglycan core protein [Anopheles ziemanni]